MIENLLKQRELLNVQIEEEQTKDIKQEIFELQKDSANLRDKLNSARLRRSTSEAEIDAQLNVCNAEIARLKNLRMSDIYFVTNLQAQINANGQKLAELTKNLREILEQN
jgi:ABC-type phosphate transport system auxiliary subunit